MFFLRKELRSSLPSMVMNMSTARSRSFIMPPAVLAVAARESVQTTFGRRQYRRVAASTPPAVPDVPRRHPHPPDALVPYICDNPERPYVQSLFFSASKSAVSDIPLTPSWLSQLSSLERARQHRIWHVSRIDLHPACLQTADHEPHILPGTAP